MRFNKKFRPDLIVGDATRRALHGVHFDGSNLTATNGRMLVRVPAVRDENDVAGTIPLHVFQSAVKWTPKASENVSLLATTEHWRIGETQADFFKDNTAIIPRPSVTDPKEAFPDVSAVLEMTEIPAERRGVICLNAEMLADLQEAFGANGVQIEFNLHDTQSAFRVTPLDGPESARCVGVFMPMKVRDASRSETVVRIHTPAASDSTPVLGADGSDVDGQVFGGEPEPQPMPSSSFLKELGEEEEVVLKLDAQTRAAALTILRDTGRASTSSLQRRMKIGYTRAAAIMDALEREGIVGPQTDGALREILVDLKTFELPIAEEKPADEAGQ